MFTSVRIKKYISSGFFSSGFDDKIFFERRHLWLKFMQPMRPGDKFVEDRLIFHVDVNSAFLSWEAVESLRRGGPDFRLIPAVVGRDPESRTSIVAAKSIPAKKYGINTAEPVSMAIRKCPGLVVVKPHFELYRENSRAFMAICRKYAPLVEQFSIDECFMDFTGTSNIYPDYMALANKIKDEIKNELGFTVNIGIGRNKLCAKMASDFEKPDKIHTLFPEEIADKMWPLPIRDLLFVGKMSAQVFKKNGIMTIGDLAKLPPELVVRMVGDKVGRGAWEYANGIDNSPVTDEVREAKGYSHSVTLEQDLTDRAEALKILDEMTDHVARKMRAENVKAFCVGVSIRNLDFQNKSHQRRLYNATDITAEIYSIVEELFDELWDGVTPLRLLKVFLTDVTHEDYSQMDIFDDGSRERARRLDKALDDIKNKFGNASISKGM